MNTQKCLIGAGRTPRVRLLLGLLLAPFVAAPFVQAQTPTITVDMNNVVRQVPAGLGGVCMAGDFWDTVTPNYRDDLLKARVGLVRIVGYPTDTTDPAKIGSVAALDRKVAQIINAGATPLFIQPIESNSNTLFKNALLRLDGTFYPTGDTTPINQRVATNITYLVSRYRSAPFNLTTQYWEVGNEPDIVEGGYRVATAQEYVDFFRLAHQRLEDSGVRNNVLLAGPVTSWDYGYDAWRDSIINAFLDQCGGMVDIVTRHQYSAIRWWESIPFTSQSLLNSPKQTLHFDHTVLGYSGRGELRLQQAMDTYGLLGSVGTGITEMNLFPNQSDPANPPPTPVPDWAHTITQGLYFVLANRNTLYNPRSLVATGFQFDRNNHFLSYYQNSAPSFPYWATYIHGVLTGNELLAQTSSNSSLVVAGSKDPKYVYILVLNRNETTALTPSITLSNASSLVEPTVFTFSATQTPLTGTSISAPLPTFSLSMPALTAKVVRFRRSNAPTPPTPPAPPTTTHFTTSFDSSPTGIQIYHGYTGTTPFVPVVSSGQLHLTHTVPNTHAAVIFNGQPLPAARTRAQIRFNFNVVHPNAEGFVFGAYSASPGAVGIGGQSLGYYGQNNRLWGVKIDNNLDQVAIIPAATTATVDGWATQSIAPYNNTNMFMVIDYDGGSGTLRARMYQGTSEAGTLRADVTNRVGVPSSLPTGTVFGFTGATSGYTQTTYIYDLSILADNGSGGNFVIGQEVIVDNPAAVHAGTWTLNQNVTSGFYGSNYDHDGNVLANKGTCTATYTPSLVGTGYRDVYVRFCSGSNRASNARYIVNHAGGSPQTVIQSQRTGGGTWVKIGTWTFNHGTGGSVVLDNTSTDGFVIADAIRFVNVAAP
jgi:hypothetical protein